jgi:RNA recognition motif-containing protein
MFFIFIRTLIFLAKKIIRLANKTVVSCGDFSVYVRNLPPDTILYTGHLTRYFERFGKVKNIAIAIDSGIILIKPGNLDKLKKKVQGYFKSIRMCDLRIPKWYGVIFRVLKSYYLLQISMKEKQIKKLKEKKSFKCIGHAFVTFYTEKARWRCLSSFNKPLCLTVIDKCGHRYF